MKFSKDEWSELKGYELVQKLFAILKEEQEKRKQAWSEDMYADKRVNDLEIGFCQGMEFVISGGYVQESEGGEDE